MEIKPVNPIGNQSWVFIGGTDAEAEAPIFWPPDVKSRLIGKDPDDEKDWRQEEKWMTEDKMVGWHHWFNGHEFEHTLGDGESQRSLAYYRPLCHKDTTERLNSNNVFVHWFSPTNTFFFFSLFTNYNIFYHSRPRSNTTYSITLCLKLVAEGELSGFCRQWTICSLDLVFGSHISE